MAKTRTTAVIMAGGKSVRMKSAKPKVLHDLLGASVVSWVLDAASAAGCNRIIVITGPKDLETFKSSLAAPGVSFRVQKRPLGTADAVKAAAEDFDPEKTEVVVVLSGDVPLIRPETIKRLADTVVGGADMAVLTAELGDPGHYGRIIRTPEGHIEKIIEYRDATEEELPVREINVGAYAASSEAFFAALEKIVPDNAQGEYYLTDAVGLYLSAGRKVVPVLAEDRSEALGINSRADFEKVIQAARADIVARHMANGVTFLDAKSAYIEREVEIGPDTVILPNVVIRGRVKIGRGCEVGPFTQLRNGTVLADGAEVGNFTECKKTYIGEGTKAKHLSYLGDTIIGKKANIGAGTITANYDGVNKHETVIGDGAHIGSNCTIVAPVKIGRNAVTGAGSVVTKGRDVADGDTVVGVPARPLGRGSKKAEKKGAKGGKR